MGRTLRRGQQHIGPTLSKVVNARNSRDALEKAQRKLGQPHYTAYKVKRIRKGVWKVILFR